MKRKQKIPLIKCFLSCGGRRNPTLIFWCPFCQIYHRHGWPAPSDKEKKSGSHRVAHCRNSSSPFRSTGYYIKPFTGDELYDLSDDILENWKQKKNISQRRSSEHRQLRSRIKPAW